MGGPFQIVGQGEHEQGGGSCGGAEINVHNPGVGGAPSQFRGRAAVVTLGCAKNQVDSEVMVGVLKNSGYEIVTDLQTVDVAVVNTCGFLQSAIDESLGSIRELSALKTTARLRKLIVAGCLVGRFGNDVTADLPEVDAFITIDDLLKVGQVASGELQETLDLAARPYFLYDDTMPRCVSGGRHMAYVKVSEGCNRPCAFCIIPKIRGGMRSRTISSVVREVQQLGAQGIREINLVAQDLTAYGSDSKGENLAALLRSLDAAKAVDWIRLLYAYPLGIDSELLSTIVELPTICNYLDFPLQHASERVLKEMRRPLGKYSPRRIVEFIKKEQPSIELRTTFITGFPGETDEDVQQLEDFIAEGHFLNVGIFTYSQERGTPAAEMEGQVPEDDKVARRDRLMLAQQKALRRRMKEFMNKKFEVLIDGTHPESDGLIVGRTRFQAPEVDGTVIINKIKAGEEIPAPGTLGLVKVSQVADYDLVGTYLGPIDSKRSVESVRGSSQQEMET